MPLEVPTSLEPMEAEPVVDLPSGTGWLLEPKYDGFRCILFRDGVSVDLRSRRQRPLARYFPEVAEAALDLPAGQLVLDGELIVPDQPFEVLQMRLHPAASRVRKLAKEHPARMIVFDLLTDETGRSLLERPFRERRAALEALFERAGALRTFVLSKATTSRATARRWLDRVGHGLDGVVAKRLDLPYRPGQRAMQKFKVWQTIDCVVGGIYYRQGGDSIEYLLMGLYDDEGQLTYVGRCGAGEDRDEIRRRVQPLLGGHGFDANAPGAPSRWSNRQRTPVPLLPKLVAEVSADHIENGRFRHGSRLVRWRDDKDPRSCTMDQLAGVQAG